MGISYGAEVLGESSGSDKVVNLSLFGDNVGNGIVNRGWI